MGCGGAWADRECYRPCMAFDPELAGRLRELLAGEHGVTEKKMFGGLGFLVNGNMCVSASGQGGMLVRIDPEGTATALKRAHASLMTMGGRSMEGWIRVAPEGVRTKREIQPWLKLSLGYVKGLPKK